MIRRILILSITMLLAAAVARRTVAQTEGLTVVGTAEVKAKPTQVIIGAVVSGEAELTNDAMVKYRDAKKRAIAAIEALKLPNVKVQSTGVTVTQAIDPNAAQMMMQGRTPALGKSKVRATEILQITITDADKSSDDVLMDAIMKVIDAGRDAGLQIGASTPRNWYEYQMEMNNGGINDGITQFKVVDLTELRQQAYKKAMDDAKANAQRLADLAGVKLGRILSIHANTIHTGPRNNNNGQDDVSDDPDNELVSGTLEEIPLRVTLDVLYEIQK